MFFVNFLNTQLVVGFFRAKEGYGSISLKVIWPKFFSVFLLFTFFCPFAINFSKKIGLGFN